MTAEVGLALATLAFVGSHLLMSHPWRLPLVQNLGESRFLLFYSAVSAVTLLWMILAYRAVDESFPLWIAPDWAWWTGSGLVLVASILLIGSLVRNPAFPHPEAKKPKMREATGVFAITRHPMMWAFMIWGAVHAALWGSPRNLIVAGGLFLLALVGSLGQDRKKRADLGRPWVEWEAMTSWVPFGALFAGRASWRRAAPHWIALTGGTALWLIVTWFHAPQVSPMAAVAKLTGG